MKPSKKQKANRLHYWVYWRMHPLARESSCLYPLEMRKVCQQIASNVESLLQHEVVHSPLAHPLRSIICNHLTEKYMSAKQLRVSKQTRQRKVQGTIPVLLTFLPRLMNSRCRLWSVLACQMTAWSPQVHRRRGCTSHPLENWDLELWEPSLEAGKERWPGMASS
jgi:hypothetical protein